MTEPIKAPAKSIPSFREMMGQPITKAEFTDTTESIPSFREMMGDSSIQKFFGSKKRAARQQAEEEAERQEREQARLRRQQQEEFRQRMKSLGDLAYRNNPKDSLLMGYPSQYIDHGDGTVTFDFGEAGKRRIGQDGKVVPDQDTSTTPSMKSADSIAKKIRTVNPGYEWEDQFEIYLNANPDKRKEIEDQASLIGSLKIARQNAMNKWIEENRPEQGYFKDESGKGYYNPKTGYHEYKEMPIPNGMPKTAYMSTGYNQGIEPGRGIYGVNRGPSTRD